MSDQGNADTPTDTPAAETPETLEARIAELEAETARLEADRVRTKRRGRVWRTTRSVLVWVLVVLTSICVVLTSTAFWVRNTVFDTDKYVALVTPIAQDPTVQDQIATKLTGQVFTALDVQARVQAILPSELQPLAGPLTNQVESFVRGRVRTFVASDTFQAFWVQANTIAHQKIVALLNGDTSQLPNIVITSGEVRINLIGAVARVLQQLGQDLVNLVGIDVTVPDFPAEEDPEAAVARLSAVVGHPLPSDFGQITIMTVDQLDQLQGAAKLIKRGAWVLLFVTILFALIAVALSRNRRRTVIALGIGAAVAFFLAIRLADRLEKTAIDAVTNAAGAGGVAATRHLLDEVISGLTAIGWWVVVIGALVAIVAFLAGHPEWFAALGRWWSGLVRREPGGTSRLDRSVAGHADLIRIVAVVIAAILLFIWGLSVLSIVVVGGLLALLLWGVAVAQQRVAGPAEDDVAGDGSDAEAALPAPK